MKVTSFEISKKLAETGFLDRLNRVGFWIARKNQDPFFVKESEMSAINKKPEEKFWANPWVWVINFEVVK